MTGVRTCDRDTPYLLIRPGRRFLSRRSLRSPGVRAAMDRGTEAVGLLQQLGGLLMAGSTPEGAGCSVLGRRTFLQGVAVAVPLACAGRGGWIAAARSGENKAAPGGRAGGLVVRQKEPENLEMPFEPLDAFLTPNVRFYVRNHFDVPRPDVKTWRLKVEGAVERPLTLTYAELTQLPARTQVALLECAGNGRSFLSPKAKGVQWDLGAVGNAEWAGVPLAAVLEKAGVRDRA